MKITPSDQDRSFSLCIFAAGLILLIPAASNGAAVPGSADAGYDGYFRMIWGLLVVLGIILLLYGLLRKKFSLLSAPEGSHIKITEMKALGSRKMLCLVEVKGEEFLLGITGDDITHLATLNSRNGDNTTFQNALEAAVDEAEP